MPGNPYADLLLGHIDGALEFLGPGASLPSPSVGMYRVLALAAMRTHPLLAWLTHLAHARMPAPPPRLAILPPGAPADELIRHYHPLVDRVALSMRAFASAMRVTPSAMQTAGYQGLQRAAHLFRPQEADCVPFDCFAWCRIFDAMYAESRVDAHLPTGHAETYARARAAAYDALDFWDPEVDYTDGPADHVDETLRAMVTGMLLSFTAASLARPEGA